MILSISTLAMIYDATGSLRAGRNVLIVAEPRRRAFLIARIVIAIAKRQKLACANYGEALDAPWVFARGAGEPAELIAKDADVYRDKSAAMERQIVVPHAVRTVVA